MSMEEMSGCCCEGQVDMEMEEESSQWLQKNVGPSERYVRIGAGAAGIVVAAELFRRGSWLAVPLAALSAAEIITGLTRYCPVNSLLGINNAEEPMLTERSGMTQMASEEELEEMPSPGIRGSGDVEFVGE